MEEIWVNNINIYIKNNLITFLLNYYMIIKIDNRECDLIQHIKTIIENNIIFNDIEVTVESLPIGDIILTEKENDFLIFERKTINDLLSSIKDGRYEEQSYRLNGSTYHNHNIIYLLEGDINRVNMFKNNKIDKITVYSAIFSLNYYKGFSVLRTLSIEETAFFICNTANKLRKGNKENKLGFYKNNNTENITPTENTLNITDDQPYVNVIKKVKKENITPDNIGEIMLSQIPGISSTTAIAIMNNYKTIDNLLYEIKKDNNCLQNITYLNSKNQTRKLNKTCITNIIKFLFNK